MSHNSLPNVTIGLDLGDRTSRTYEVNAAGECEREATVPTTVAGITRYFEGRARCRVVLEVGTPRRTQSPSRNRDWGYSGDGSTTSERYW